MKIYYLYHSAFLVELQEHLLVLDYYEDKPKGGTLADGVLNPAELATLATGKQLVFLASHRHGDHYTKDIFSFKQAIPTALYLLSHDIKSKENAIFIAPGESKKIAGLTVQALPSTDEGVAFLIEVEGQIIYHAGDLNWWHWEGESAEYNSKMEKDYKAALLPLQGVEIDMAFLPADPRQGDAYLWGFDYFMRTYQPATAVPMHFGADLTLPPRLMADPMAKDYAQTRVLSIAHRGEEITCDEAWNQGVLFIHYPKCTTCQKAGRWLADHGIATVSRHIVEDPPTPQELDAWSRQADILLQKFFNTSGLRYKALGLKDKLPTMPRQEQLQLLASDGMLVKRPLIIGENKVLLGFKPQEWEEKLL